MDVSDFGATSGELLRYEQEHEKSLFGEMVYLSLDYQLENTDVYTQVYFYQSRYSWVLNLLKQQNMRTFFTLQMASSQNKLLLIKTSQALSEEQFQTIREKLGV